jgi:GntR family transcriptional regulator/MocR family aminotransferase
VDTEALSLRLRAEGVLIEPGRAFFAGDGARNHYRLAYSSIAPQRIPEGVARIARGLARH